MVKNKSLIIVTSLLIYAMPTLSAYCQLRHKITATPASYTTFGAVSCKDWNANREEKEHSIETFRTNVADLAHNQWIAGFLSGFGAANVDIIDKKVFDALDVNTVSDWLDTHCSSNKEDNVPAAIQTLLIKLNAIKK